jgi:hypothetical protein
VRTPGGTNTCFGGTSSSSPFAAGVGLLVKQAATGSTGAVDVRAILRGTGDTVTDPKNGMSSPRVNSLAAAQAGAALVPSPPPAPYCGDGIIGGTEACDGTNLNGKTCQTQGFSAGTLSCAPNTCALNTSACYSYYCGDGIKNTGSEQCDGADLGGKTCMSLGYAQGTLSCTASTCLYNTAPCSSAAAVCGGYKSSSPCKKAGCRWSGGKCIK